jgi:hypothetical protein
MSRERDTDLSLDLADLSGIIAALQKGQIVVVSGISLLQVGQSINILSEYHLI